MIDHMILDILCNKIVFYGIEIEKNMESCEEVCYYINVGEFIFVSVTATIDDNVREISSLS